MSDTATPCRASGTHDGKPWACDRPAVVRGLCDAHRKAEDRGRPLAPLRVRFEGETVQLTIRVPADQVAQLGPNPNARAGEIVRAALGRRRRKA